MARVTPKLFYEVNKQLTHCEGANGNDYTLCGFTLDGSEGEMLEGMSNKIDCPDCLVILRFCRAIHGRAISPSDRSGDK